ncbi:MAG: serine/threonine-protein kinase [Gemmatimonadales bacterium]|nr:serine/threonine-protein kinase [Gemmatimonadales bacterium]
MTDKLLTDLTAALGDAYDIERELAGGGMSRVFVAREQALGREVVIKVLPPELAAGLNHERFRREIQLAARLSHPYIVPLLHAGEAGELLWFTMPYIAGDSIRSRLQADGPFGVRETLAVLHDVMEALAYAHSRGVIHRDIKPANILADGQHALVADFGVAKALGASLPTQGVAGHTSSGFAIGTPAYMAPEQLAADPSADHRVDIYATGLLAWELLTGASPFAAPSPTATMTAQLTRTPDPLHTLRDDVPPALSALVARCLSKNAEDRPESAEAVLGELDAIQGALAADVHRSRSGESAARRAGISWPLALAATAVVVGGIWWSGRDPVSVPVVVPQAATPIVAGGDAEELDTLPPPSNRPMTRADSLAIAQALRDELDRLDPEGVTAPARPADVASIEATLARELARTDSIVRLRLIELTARRPDRSRPGLPSSAEGFSSLDQPRGDRSISVMRATPSAVRRVMVVAPPSRWRDSAARVASDTIVAELSRWLGRSEGWQVVPAAPRVEGEESPADVLVTVGFTPVATDSAVLRILVRNMSAGSSFGYRSVASTPHPLPVEPRAFRGTVREALSVLEQLRRTPSGEPWTLDMGRP